MTGVLITTYLQMFSNTKSIKRKSKMKNEVCKNPYCTCNPCRCTSDDQCSCCVETPD